MPGTSKTRTPSSRQGRKEQGCKQVLEGNGYGFLQGFGAGSSLRASRRLGALHGLGPEFHPVEDPEGRQEIGPLNPQAHHESHDDDAAKQGR